MSNNFYENLSGKILIATPYELNGGVFYKSLVYMLSHAKEGSVGIIVNQIVKTIPNSLFFSDMIFKEGNLNEEILQDYKDNLNNDSIPIFFGGPHEIERMFFLHTDDYDKNLIFKSNNSGIALSSNPQILKDISQGLGPKKNVSIVGYTLWTKGELEHELENNLWIVSDYDKNLIFSNIQGQKKWDLALKNIGINNNISFMPSLGIA